MCYSLAWSLLTFIFVDFQKRQRIGQHGRKCGRGNKGQGQRGTLPRIGFEGGATPFYLLIPKEPYYHGVQ